MKTIDGIKRFSMTMLRSKTLTTAIIIGTTAGAVMAIIEIAEKTRKLKKTHE